MSLTGRWRIVAMELWDTDAIDLVAPGFIEFDSVNRPGSCRDFLTWKDPGDLRLLGFGLRPLRCPVLLGRPFLITGWWVRTCLFRSRGAAGAAPLRCLISGRVEPGLARGQIASASSLNAVGNGLADGTSSPSS